MEMAIGKWQVVSSTSPMVHDDVLVVVLAGGVGEHWYQGTADAVYQNLYSIVRETPRYVIVLAGDHIYKMDYRKMLQAHVDWGAAVTLASIEVPREHGQRFGIVAMDE